MLNPSDEVHHHGRRARLPGTIMATTRLLCVLLLGFASSMFEYQKTWPFTSAM